MNDFIILTDSACDLSAEMVEELRIEVLPMSVDVDGDVYRNFPDHREIDPHVFYERLKTAKSAKTAAVNQAQFYEIMEPLIAAGNDVLYLGFSSGLSSSFSAGALAAQELRAKYPQRKVYAVDTLCASLGQGLLVYHACMKRQEGKSIDEVRNWVEENRLNLCHWFTVDDLMFLKRGGRVSATTAIVGSMLNIKPILHVDDEGHLIKMGVARGRRASIRALLQEMVNRGIDIENQHVFISHGDCEEDANYLAGLVRTQCNVKDITINFIGPVIGAHSGPGTLALFFLGNKR